MIGFGKGKKEDSKAKTEGKAVDQDGNEVKVDVIDNETGKPVKTWKDHLKTALKIAVATATVVGTGAISYVVGGKKVGKEKDKVIRSLNSENMELHERVESLESQMMRPEDEETSEEETF